MNLADCLTLTGLNRNTYNSLGRRYRHPDGDTSRDGTLAFMEMRRLPNEGQDTYGLIHAVALGCLLDLREAGVSPMHAVTVIDETFDYIADQVEWAAEHPASLSKPNLIRYFPNASGNYGWSAGAADDASLGRSDGPVISIDLNDVIRRIWNATSRWLGIKVG